MRLEQTGRDGFYRVRSAAPLRLFVSSSPAGRRLLCDPTLVGTAFQATLRQACERAVTDLLQAEPSVTEALVDVLPDVLYILRGGLNFGLHEVVEQVLGRPCRVSFMSSRREVRDGRAVVTGDEYRQIDLGGASVLFVGDIAATGQTITNALTVLGGQGGDGAFASHVVIVTIGTRAAAERISTLLGESTGAPRGLVTMVALEGLFGVYQQEYDLALHLDQTDFIPRGGLISPEFRAASARDPVHLLERCVIYDGGLRGFAPGAHLRHLLDYWEMLCAAFAENHDLIGRHLAGKNDHLPSGVDLIEVDDELVSRLDYGSILGRCYAHRDRIRRAYDRLTGSRA
ncbi:hypothetical protein GCM10027280_26220 [Micromonospora polyrhachis]|uniref:Hypoxanthine-guanine phosphoribosyltransferase n=1 Tax=Micromonospora polyrhachis TaxID=1282883 RepID=A0A7W7SNJ4_9ACTN|nr:hypothetical protein [Micromonospora polyrhachis]MBB4957716.1 hypoxanthine-guanine phosphoribosyltransferase [Micromonospora polyrhachis]